MFLISLLLIWPNNYLYFALKGLRITCDIQSHSITRFKMIKPLELFNQAWTKEDKKVTSPNVLWMINNFNRLSGWVTSEIVSCTGSTKKRAQILKHFISIGYVSYIIIYFHLFTLNFSLHILTEILKATFMVTLSLSQHVVARLSETWKVNLSENWPPQWMEST